MDEISAPTAEKPPPKPKGGPRPGSGRKRLPPEEKARRKAARKAQAAAAGRAGVKPTMHDIMRSAAEFHYSEAVKAQQVLMNPAATTDQRADAVKKLEHHLGKAAHHAKPALPYELAKLAAQKPPPARDPDDIDLALVTDAELDQLETIRSAARRRSLANAGGDPGRKAAPGN